MTGNKHLKIIVWIILVLLGILAYFSFTLSGHKTVVANPQDKKQSVHVLSIVPENKTIRQTYIGYVKPINQVAVHTYIPGFIDKVVVQGGQMVKSGELLFTLKQDEYRAQMDLAKAKVSAMQATLENASVHYERMKTAGKQAISKTDLDNARTAFLTAEAELQQAKAEERLAQVNYDYTMLYAPISGRVGDVSISVGDYVFPQSSALADIIQFNPIRVQFSISDKVYLDEIKQGKLPFSDWKMYLKLANGNVYHQTGQIKYLNNEINPSTSAITVYADFDNPDGILVPNAYVDVVLEKQIQNGIFVPQSAVNFTSQGTIIYTLSSDNKITATPVQVGVMSEGLYYIPSGLTVGTKVITDKISSYQIGQKVEGVNP